MANVVPTLGSISLLSNPKDIIMYQLNFFAAVPKDMSNLFYNEIKSLPEISSLYSHDKQLMRSYTQKALLEIFTRIFGNGSSSITVTTEDIDVTKYRLIISVLVNQDGIVYSLTQDNVIDSEGRISTVEIEGNKTNG